MNTRMTTSTAITLREDCTVACTVVGDSVEVEIGDHEHNITLTFRGDSLDAFLANVTAARAERDARPIGSREASDDLVLE